MVDSRFLKACNGQQVDQTPVWFMRQAGRYLEEYRKLRQRYTLLEICKTPELATRVTLQPIRRFDLDAAIIFADILLPLEGMGLNLEFIDGKGPTIDHPLRTPTDVKELNEPVAEEELGFVFDAIRAVRSELPSRIPLIGFAGAPFTIASYAIEGGYSRTFLKTKSMMYQLPATWKLLMEKLTRVTIEYVQGQIEAGAQAIQIFDSWVGSLDPEDYRHYVLPYSRKIFSSLQDHRIPLIHFGTATAGLLELMKEAGGNVISVDWRVGLTEVWDRLGSKMVIQGNLDPAALLAPKAILETKVEKILEQVGGRPGHIFNLGHGILPQTPIENVDLVVEWVHQKSRKLC